MSKTNYIWILLVWAAGAFSLYAQDSSLYSSSYLKVLSAVGTWNQTSNPVAFSEIPRINFGNLSVDWNRENGNFKPVLHGTEQSSFELQTEKYQTFGKTSVWGKFVVNKSKEYQVNYNNINDAYRGTPFVVYDSIGGDAIDREFYDVSGAFSTQLERLTFGAALDYTVGASAHNHDPRARSVVTSLNLRPGLNYKLGQAKLGGNFEFKYYNEDIDITSVDNTVEHTLFYSLGIRAATQNASSSFLRLYKRLTYGGELQFEYKNFLLYGGGAWYKESTDDGRGTSGASWATIRNFAELNGGAYHGGAVYKIGHGRKEHRFKVHTKYEQNTGTEIEQQLVSLPNTTVYQWVTLHTKESYTQKDLALKAEYAFVKYMKGYIPKHMIMGHVAYDTKTEDYLPFSDELKIATFHAGLNILNQWQVGEGIWAVDIALAYHFSPNHNLYINHEIGDFEVEFPDYYPFIENNIVRPDYSYFIARCTSSKLTVSYEHTLSQVFDTWYIKGGLGYSKPVAETLLSRTVLRLCLGFLF